MFGHQDLARELYTPQKLLPIDEEEGDNLSSVKISKTIGNVREWVRLSAFSDDVVNVIDQKMSTQILKVEEETLQSEAFSGQTVSLFNRIKKYYKNKPDGKNLEEPLVVPIPLSEEVIVEILNSKEEIDSQFYEFKELVLNSLDEVHQDRVSLFFEYIQKELTNPGTNQKEYLGKLLYVVDTQSDVFQKKLVENTEQEIIEWVDDQFDASIQKIQFRLNNLIAIHKKSGIQSDLHSYQTSLPYEIAQVLLRLDGSINYFLCSVIFRKLIGENGLENTHQKNMLRVLNLIESSLSIRSKISKIKRPKSVKSLANNLIKVGVEKGYDEVVTDRDAKVVALTACLSQLRQGPIGSCFATHFAIVLLSSHLEQCLDDFYDLLSEGSLTRTIDNFSKQFPFLLRMGNSDGDYNIKVNEKGCLTDCEKKGVFLWNCPGILASCKAVDIQNVEKVIFDIIQQDIQNNQGIVNLRSLLSKLCDHQITKYNIPRSKKVRLYALARFAYESNTRNGLLSVWENSIAEMADGEKDSMVMSAILYSARTLIIKSIMDKLEISTNRDEIIANISAIFDHHFMKHTHLHYDPDIINNTIDPQNQSSEGGYVIYDKQGEDIPKRWKRIDSPKLYAQFIQDIFSDAKEKIAESLTKNFTDQSVMKVIGQINQYIMSATFISESMTIYYPKYQTMSSLESNWELCRYTPWRTICGNRTERVREVYMEDEQTSQMLYFTPNNPNEVLMNILSLEKKLTSNELIAYLKNPLKKVPVFTPTHAFTLTLGDRSIFDYITSAQTKKEWIKENITEPGAEIVNCKVDDSFRKRIISFVAEKIILEEKRAIFLKETSFMASEISYPQLRNNLLDIIKRVDNQHLDIIDVMDLTEVLDTEICAALPVRMKNELAAIAVHFADTNWSRGLNDIHFCFMVSPCTGSLAIMEIQDDGQDIRPVKEYWLMNQPWKIFNHMSNPLPHND